MQTQTPTDTPAKRRRRKWPWFLGGAVLLILLGVTLGPFIYIHFIQADPCPPLSVSSSRNDCGAAPATTATATAGSTATSTVASTAASSGGAAASSGSAAASGGIDGTWTVTSGSQAGYRVKEVLFGQDTDAVGRASTVTGTISITGTTVNDGSFTVDLTTVHSDESQRDQQFQGRIMQTAKFPDATFKLTKPIDLGNLPGDKTEVQYTATGDLTLHGVTKSVDVPISARRNGANIEVSGTIPVKFSDYQIDNPSTAAVTTQDNGAVEFLLVLAHS